MDLQAVLSGVGVGRFTTTPGQDSTAGWPSRSTVSSPRGVAKESALLAATASSATRCAGPIRTTFSIVPRPGTTRAVRGSRHGPGVEIAGVGADDRLGDLSRRPLPGGIPGGGGEGVSDHGAQPVGARGVEKTGHRWHADGVPGCAAPAARVLRRSPAGRPPGPGRGPFPAGLIVGRPRRCARRGTGGPTCPPVPRRRRGTACITARAAAVVGDAVGSELVPVAFD